MTGPEHYREAERLRAVSEGEDWCVEGGRLERVAVLLAAAQVHATLALAAATAQTLAAHAWPEVSS